MRLSSSPFSLAILTLPFLLTGLFDIVPTASAAEAVCDCYCESKTGATHYPAEASAKIPKSECQSACPTTYPGYTMAVCATTSDQLPSQNVSCFTAPQCKQQNGEFDTKFQPPECAAGSRYCYPDKSKAAKVTLSTSIAGLTVTGDLGEYISKVYQWMLGAATTIAIVLMMVSGLRWSLGGLSAEQVKKAKTTIRNAMVGLVLLLGSYLILFTVNPQLLKLQVPSFPMIRQIALVSAGTSCGYLTGDSGRSGRRTEYDSDLKMDLYIYGDAAGYPDSPHNKTAPAPKGGKPYKLADPSNGEACGSVAKVVKDFEGNSLQEGTTCTWDTCTNPGEKCLTAAGEAKCRTCESIVFNNKEIQPSSSLCAQLSLPTETKTVTREKLVQTVSLTTRPKKETVTEDVPMIQQCFWTRDASMIAEQSVLNTFFDTPGDVLNSTGSCAMLTLDCEKIQTCEDYDRGARVSNFLRIDQPLQVIRNHGPQTGLAGFAGSFGDQSLTSVCNEDPCKVEVEGKTVCRMDQPQPRVTGSFSDLVSLQFNDCKTHNIP